MPNIQQNLDFGTGFITNDQTGETVATFTNRIPSIPRNDQPAIRGQLGYREEASPSMGLASQMQDINNLRTPEEKLAAIYKLKGGVEQTLAGFRNNAMNQAENEYRVDELESQLNHNIALDQADPEYAKFLSDSPITHKIRATFLAAKEAARMAGDKYFQTNPEAAKLMGTIEPFIKVQEMLINKSMAKEDVAELERNRMLATFGTSPMEVSSIVEPGADPILHSTKMINNKQFLETVQGIQSPQDLLPLAIAGNPYAKKALAHKQAEAQVGTKDKNPEAFRLALDTAERDLSLMREITNSQAAYEKKLAELQPNKEKRDNQLSLLTALGTGKEADEQRKNVRAAFASQYIAEIKKQDFLGNINSWSTSAAFQDSSSPLNLMYKKAREKIGSDKISLQALTANINAVPKEQRALARQQLGMIAQQAAKKASNGYFGGFADTVNVDTLINMNISTGLIQDMGEVVGGVLGRPFESVLPTTAQLAIQAGKSGTSAISDLMSGILKGIDNGQPTKQ